MNFLLASLISLSFFLIFATSSYAEQSNRFFSKPLEKESQFIAIVNPVRMPTFTDDPMVSLEAQYAEIKKRKLPATWLLTNDILLNKKTISFLRSMDRKQEFGIFLEVSPKLADQADVNYNRTDSWHRANSLFLIGYKQDDRIKLIDKSFENFRDQFGYYPISVGAWWVDSYSLEYMQKKYNITTNLGLADQLYTDNYNVWGQYWSTPFYPSKLHAAIPASSEENKLNLVTIQWAPRDPLNGYTGERTSLYSTQDYRILGFKDEYFEKLINLYAKRHRNQYGLITVGLEGDLDPNSYRSQYASQLDIVKRITDQEQVQAVTMGDFGMWYLSAFPKLSPPHIIESDDLLGKRVKSIWYQSPKYRINITHDYATKETKIRDFRTYHVDFAEPFYSQASKQLNLLIDTPAQIDSARDKKSTWLISKADIVTVIEDGELFEIRFKDGNYIKVLPDKINIGVDNTSIPEAIRKSPVLKIEDFGGSFQITPSEKWVIPPEGYLFNYLLPERPIFLVRKSYVLVTSTLFLLVLILVWRLFVSSISPRIKKVIFGSILITVILTVFSYQMFVKKYYVSQSEMDALYRLAALPDGKVAVFDQDCPRCVWSSKYKPATLANKKDYISWITKKDIVYNSLIFNTQSREEGREELKKIKAKYIYLSKYDDHVEKMPFSPGDYKIEIIFENANAEIWRVDERSPN